MPSLHAAIPRKLHHNRNMARGFLMCGSILAFLSVALGAFAAHALKSRLTPNALEVFRTAVDYQAYHALALILVAGIWHFRPDLSKLKTACMLFAAGVVVFSGSLYLLALTGVTWLGAITPIGGICFLAAWVMVTWAAASLPVNPRP